MSGGKAKGTSRARYYELAKARIPANKAKRVKQEQARVAKNAEKARKVPRGATRTARRAKARDEAAATQTS